MSGNDGERRRVPVVGLNAATWDLMLPWVEVGELPTRAPHPRGGPGAVALHTARAHTAGMDVRGDGTQSGQAPWRFMDPSAQGEPDLLIETAPTVCMVSRVGHA